MTVPVGYGSDKLTDKDLLFNDRDSSWKKACSSVLEHIVITPTGKLSICCGIGSDDIPETVIGDTSEKSLLQLLQEANNDIVVNWLALEGPYEMMRFIQHKAPEIPFRKRYVNSCHLCHDIFTRREARTVLQRSINEKSLILSLKRAWLEMHREEISEQAIGQQ